MLHPKSPEGDGNSACLFNKIISRNADQDSRHVIALDEPEIGLSDEYTLALGRKIEQFSHCLSPLCDALMIVSHSRYLVTQLLPIQPHFIRFGDISTFEWLAKDPVAASLEDLDALLKANKETFVKINKILQNRK